MNEYVKNRIKTDVNFRLNRNTRRKIHQALQGKTKSSSTKDILGIDVDTYKKWFEFQFTPEMNWINIENDHVKPICMFDVTKDEEFREVFSWKNTQPLLRHDHQQKGAKFNFLDYQLQFIRAYQFIKLNEEGLTRIFKDEIYSKPPRKNYPTNKIMIESIDETWSSDLLDMNDYGIKSNKGYRYILVIIDNFSNFGWTIPLKNKYAQSITDAYSQNIKTSRRKPNLHETDDGKEYLNKNFGELLNNHNIKRYSGKTALGAVFAERFNRTIRNLLKKPAFEKRRADWVSELPSVTEKYKDTIYSSTKMTPIQASIKSNEKLVYSNLQDKRRKLNPKFKLGQLVRTADIKRVFSKGDSTNYSYKLYTITEVIHDTIPCYRIDYLLEKYNENLLLPTKLTLKENNQVMKKLNLIQ